LSVGLSLPLFDGNRGNIAIERATRQKLRDEYEARVQADRNDVALLLKQVHGLDAQLPLTRAHAAQLAKARDAAQRAFANGLLDWPTYLSIRASSLAADTDLLTLQQNADEQSIALDALVGAWPDASQLRAGQEKAQCSPPRHSGTVSRASSGKRNPEPSVFFECQGTAKAPGSGFRRNDDGERPPLSPGAS
ncbi:MAG TPA: TolC family protein, partial [Rhodanobacteraceae bacterium]